MVWNPQLGLIGSNRRCSSVMETHFSVHHRSLITGTCVRFEKEIDMKFMISLQIMANSYVVLIKFIFEVKNFVKELLHKRTLIIVKAIP